MRFLCLAAWYRRARKAAAITATRRQVVPPTAIPAACDVVSGGGLPAAVDWLGVLVEVWVAGDVSVPSVSTPPLFDTISDVEGDVKLTESIWMLETLIWVVKGTDIAVELAASWVREACIAPACVVLILIAASVFKLVDNTE